MRFHVTGLVLFLVGFSANAQVDPGFNGRWTGSGKTIFEMSPAAMKYSPLACDEGTCRRVKPFLCRWSAVGDRLRDDPGPQQRAAAEGLSFGGVALVLTCRDRD